MPDLSSNLAPELAGTPQYGDLVVANGDLLMTSDVQVGGTHPVLQQICQNMRTYLGEYFLDNTLGVAWFQNIIGTKNNPEIIDGMLQNVILTCPGVLQLTAWSSVFDAQARRVSLSFSVSTVLGAVDYNANVPIAPEGI